MYSLWHINLIPNSPPPPEPTPAVHLRQLTLTHMPQYADSWTAAPLHTNLHVKAKVSEHFAASHIVSGISQWLHGLFTKWHADI